MSTTDERRAVPRFASVVFDVDSTLATIEGIDWLADLRDVAVARECADLTTRAMAGEFPIEAVYTKRLERIAPTAEELRALGIAYCNALVPGAQALLADLLAAGVNVHLVSGGLRAAILPLAATLNVSAAHVHAVDVLQDVRGHFTALDGEQLLATQSGKALVIAALSLARPSVIIGDGSTDMAARTAVDAFIAFTGVARRDIVVAQADAEARDFGALRALLFDSTD